MEALASWAQQPHFKGSIVKEYLLVVKLQADVQQQVLDEQQAFLERYRPAGCAGTPQIVVAAFLAKEEMEETLLRWMHRIISSHRSFRSALNNYGTVPSGTSLFIRVQDHQPFRQLSKDLKVVDELVTSNGLPKARLIAHPHLTLAAGMEKKIYDEVLPEYSRKDFHASFEVNELVLVKRTSSTEACSVVNVFRLQP